MIILPEKNAAIGKILRPQKRNEWQTPSQRASFASIESQTRFRLTARLHDGHIAWRGWFDDREDADAFLFSMAAGSLNHEQELWNLPNPSWRPGLGDLLSYDFATVRFLTGTSGSNQTDTVPSDWNSANNSIETIASGGGAAAAGAAAGSSSGGGGAAYSKATNVSLTPGSSATYHLEVGGAGGTGVGGSGTTGGDCWYNATTLAGSSVGSKGGVGAAINTGGTGGASGSGIGSTKNSGGNGGQITAGGQNGAGGGGGSGGPNGIGGNGGSSSSGVGGGGGGGGNGGGSNGGSATTGTGGNGGNNSASSGGGSGGAPAGAGSAGTAGGGGGGAGFGGSSAGAASSGIEFDATHGSGSGAGGSSGVNQAGLNGALYGAGGAGAGYNGLSENGGNGAQAIIVATYVPLSIFGFNMPMLGM